MRILVDYRGRQVRLTDERLRHILEHAEMADLAAQLEETVLRPESVVQSTSDESASLLYRFYAATRMGSKWLCVVVKYQVDDAFVLTAYLTDKPKQGLLQWPNA